MRNPDELWREYVKEIEDFIVSHRREPKMTQRERFMAAWLSNQRTAREEGKLCDWKLDLLQDVEELCSGAVATNNIIKLHALELYVSEHGEIPSFTSNCSSLYKWLKRMVILAENDGIPRVLRKRMETVGVDFSNREWGQSRTFLSWQKQLDLYKEFCEAHGRTPRSVGAEGPLYRWAYKNRVELKKRGFMVVGQRKKERRATAKTDKHTISVSVQHWKSHLDELSLFLEENGRLPKENENPALVKWITHQETCASKGTLADWKVSALTGIGIEFKTVKVAIKWVQNPVSENKKKKEPDRFEKNLPNVW